MFNLEKAKKAGYSEEDIAMELSTKHPNFNFAGATNAGYSLEEINSDLAAKALPKAPSKLTGEPLAGVLPVDDALDATPSMERYEADLGRPMMDAPDYVPPGVEPDISPSVKPSKANWGEVALEAPIKSVVPSLGMMAGGLEIAGAERDLEHLDYTEAQMKMGTYPGQEADLEDINKNRDEILRERQEGVALFRGSKETMAEIQPDVEYGTPKYYVGAALQSVAQMAPSLTASIATGNPLPSMIYMGMVSGGMQYGELTEAGIDPTTARYAALGYALAEGIPEAFPVGVILKGGKAATRILKTAGAETAQEEVTEALQMAIDKGTISPDMTWAEAKQRFKDVAIISPIAGTTMAMATQPFVGKAPEVTPEPTPLPPMAKVAPVIKEKAQIKKEKIERFSKTHEFKKWFGESKLTDDKREPLVLYHGTDNMFETFDKEAIGKKFGEIVPVVGFNFIKDPDVAANYGTTILPVYIKAENPLYIDTDYSVTHVIDENAEALAAQIKESKKTDNPYDAIIARGIGEEEGQMQIVVFEPSQIKSVFEKQIKTAKKKELKPTDLPPKKEIVPRGTQPVKKVTEEKGLEPFKGQQRWMASDNLKSMPEGEYRVMVDLPTQKKIISYPGKDKTLYTKQEAVEVLQKLNKKFKQSEHQYIEIDTVKPRPAAESVVTGELPKKPVFGDERGEVSLEGVEKIPGRVKKAETAVKEFFTPFSTIPQEKAYEELRYKTLGKLDRVEGVISKIWKRTKDLPSEQKKALFDFLAGRIEKTALPMRLQPMAVSLRTQHNLVGKMLVKRGLMTQKTYEENRDSYIKFMYLKHLEGGKGGGGKGLKLGLSYQKGRMDAVMNEIEEGKYQIASKGGHKYSKSTLTKEAAIAKQKAVQEQVEEYRRSIGLIEDISVAAPTGLSSTLSDITKFDFMQEMSKNPDWVWQDSMVKVDGKRMGIGKLTEEIETQKRIVEQAPNVPEARKKLDGMESALAEATAKTDKAPEDFVQLPVAKAYGDLSGAYIRKEIALDIQPVVRMFSDSTQFGKIVNAGIKAEEQLVAAFKVGKVALNPPTIARNILSNQIQLNMSGIPLYKLPMYWGKAALAMKNKSQYYNEARRQGIFRTNWALTEIDEVLDTVKTMEKDGYAGVIGSIGKLAKFYGKIDDFFKLLKYIEQREGGASKGKSSREAQKWVMDYSRATPSIKFARKHLLPMVTFQYKIVPLIAESLVKRPWVIAKYMMIPYLMQEMAKQELDIDDEEWDKLEKQLPKYVRESGVYTLYPVRSPEGNLQWVNLEYYVPWQGFIGLNQMVKKGDYGEAIGDTVRHPILDVITSFKTAKGEDPPKDTFTGRELYNRLDTPTDKALKTSEWLVSKWAPSAFTRRGAAHKSLQVALPEHFGAKDRYGRKVTKSQALGKWVGFNIVSPTPKQVALEKLRRIKEVDRAVFKVIANPANSEKYKKQIRAAGKKEKDKIKRYYGKGD